MPDFQLRPGVFREFLAPALARIETGLLAGVEAVAVAVRDEARDSFVGQHAVGTPSPARRGGPPSRISRTLHDSMTYTGPARSATGWVSHVGPQPGMYPFYSRRTDSATYGWYLEKPGAGKKHLRYPFLEPAFNRVVPRVYDLFRAQRWL